MCKENARCIAAFISTFRYLMYTLRSKRWRGRASCFSPCFRPAAKLASWYTLANSRLERICTMHGTSCLVYWLAQTCRKRYTATSNLWHRAALIGTTGLGSRYQDDKLPCQRAATTLTHTTGTSESCHKSPNSMIIRNLLCHFAGRGPKPRGK